MITSAKIYVYYLNYPLFSNIKRLYLTSKMEFMILLEILVINISCHY